MTGRHWREEYGCQGQIPPHRTPLKRRLSVSTVVEAPLRDLGGRSAARTMIGWKMLLLLLDLFKDFHGKSQELTSLFFAVSVVEPHQQVVR